MDVPAYSDKKMTSPITVKFVFHNWKYLEINLGQYRNEQRTVIPISILNIILTKVEG